MSEETGGSPRSIRCYVEAWMCPVVGPDLRLREKGAQRLVRLLTTDPQIACTSPLANLMKESFGHGGGLTDPMDYEEFIELTGLVDYEDSETVGIWLVDGFQSRVKVSATSLGASLKSLWCYVEEYPGADGLTNARLREKGTGRKVEMWGTEKDFLTTFLSSPGFTDSVQAMPNLYQKEGFEDYVLVSGATTVDTHDSIRFAHDSSLVFLFGPSLDTAYRDALRESRDEVAAEAHQRTAKEHLYQGRYREALLSARLALESACGGDGKAIKMRLEGAPAAISGAAAEVWDYRNLAVHESEVRVEQQAAEGAVSGMSVVLEYIKAA